MARHRLPPATVLPEATPPQELRACVVEDWVSPTELPAGMAQLVNGKVPDAENVADLLVFTARRRHREALSEWGAERGVDHPGFRSPRFADRDAFVAAVKRARGR